MRLQLKEKTFRKESDPTYSTELHQVELNNHNGVYIVDGVRCILEKLVRCAEGIKKDFCGYGLILWLTKNIRHIKPRNKKFTPTGE